MDQFIIKCVLIIAFVGFAVILLRPGGSARGQAARTLMFVLFLAAAIIAVLFPNLVNELAVAVGVGRGTDLLLYAFILVFIGHALSTTRKRRKQEEQITELARRLALMNPETPEKAG